MKTSYAKFLSAAVIAAALIATVAIARTVHTGPAAADARAHHSAMGASSSVMALSPLRGSIACGTMSYLDCERLEQLLPM